MPSPGHARSEPQGGTTVLSLRPAAGLGGLGLAIVLAALAFAALPLQVVGVGFVALGLLTPAWVVIAARTARLSRRLSTHRVVEEEPFEAIIDVRRGWLGLPGAQVQDPLADTVIPVAEPLALLGGRGHVQLRVIARIGRRGRHRFPAPSLAVSDPLGLTLLGRTGAGAEEEVLVLPRTEAVRWLRRDHRQAATGAAHRALQEPMGAGEVDGLRQYMEGTPASRIHWPALARGHGLLERRLVSEPHTLPLIVLDPRERNLGDTTELLDDAVRAAASLTLELARGGGCQLLLPGDRVPAAVGSDLVAWPALHTRLALIEPEPDPRRGPALRPDAARGPLFYVAARLDTEGALAAAGAHVTQLVLVVPRRLGRGLEIAPSFEVSGCTGHLLRARRKMGGRGRVGARAA